MANQLGVLITYHDEEALLHDCLELLLSAADVPDEILIYDDASMSPAQAHIIAHPAVRVVRGVENRGPSFARNELLHHSTCDYVHFHDADDLIYTQWCQQVRQMINASQPDLILNQVVQSNGDKEMLLFDFAVLAETKDVLAFFARQSTVTQMLTFRRELGIKIGGYNTYQLAAALDVFFNFKVAAASTSYTVLPEPLVEHRLRANSLSRDGKRQLNQKNQLAFIQALTMLTHELPVQYHDALAEKVAESSSRFFQNGYYAEAKAGFTTASAIGQPSYSYRHRAYQLLAHLFGPYMAEQISTWYRTIIPHNFRVRVSRWLLQVTHSDNLEKKA
jgi:glycosyltransferase involved in cell wall biosynthesis